MEDIDDYPCAPIPKHDMAAHKDPLAIRRWWWQSAVQINGNNDDAAFQFSRKRRANYELSFQPRRQAVPSSESRWKMPVMIGIPAADLVTIVIREAVAPAVLVIIVVLAFISPVPVVAIAIPMVTISMLPVSMVAVSLTGIYSAPRTCNRSGHN